MDRYCILGSSSELLDILFENELQYLGSREGLTIIELGEWERELAERFATSEIPF